MVEETKVTKVKWTNRIRDEEVLTSIGEEIKLIRVRRKKASWLEQVLCKKSLQRRIIKRKLWGGKKGENKCRNARKH